MNPSELIDRRITELDDWRGKTLTRLRALILEAAPNLVEEWKWDTPVWSFNGDVVAAGAFQDHVKLNFFHGALLEDHHLFNAGLDAQKTRAIDIYENDNIDEEALKNLIRSAVELNALKPTKPAKKPAIPKKKPSTARTKRFGKGKPQTNSTTARPIHDFPKLSAPAQRALAGAGIKNLKQLSKFSEAQIKGLHGIGPNAMVELRRALKKQGLSFTNDK